MLLLKSPQSVSLLRVGATPDWEERGYQVHEVTSMGNRAIVTLMILWISSGCHRACSTTYMCTVTNLCVWCGVHSSLPCLGPPCLFLGFMSEVAEPVRTQLPPSRAPETGSCPGGLSGH